MQPADSWPHHQDKIYMETKLKYYNEDLCNDTGVPKFTYFKNMLTFILGSIYKLPFLPDSLEQTWLSVGFEELFKAVKINRESGVGALLK